MADVIFSLVNYSDFYPESRSELDHAHGGIFPRAISSSEKQHKGITRRNGEQKG